MTVQELIDQLNEQIKRDSSIKDNKIVIPIKLDFPSIGPSHCIEIDSLHFGFNWNKGRVFLVSNKVAFTIKNEKIDEKIKRNKYKCNKCGKVVTRNSTKAWISSYCDDFGMTTRLYKIKEKQI
ncbi:MAG: hypothetical protein WC438_05975 [Candidatus Pacearchaeota archaeon]